MFIGRGVNPRDSGRRGLLVEKGDKAGDPYSKFQLALLLTYDPDVTPNINRATTLLTQSSNLGYADAMAAMGDLYRNRKLRGTADDAIAWFRKAAAGLARGHARSG